jgi:hypothetical protein
MNSTVKAYYHGGRVATAHADRRGSISLRFPVPAQAQPPYYVVLTDADGNYASFSGLSVPRPTVGGRRGPRPQG